MTPEELAQRYAQLPGSAQDEVADLLTLLEHAYRESENPGWTDEEVRSYKEFIDGLQSGWPRTSVEARRVREWGQDAPKSYTVTQEWNELMAGLTQAQREAIADLLQCEHEGGMFEVMVYFDDSPYWIYERREDGHIVVLPHKPFFNFLHDDWAHRALGLPWFDEEETNEGSLK